MENVTVPHLSTASYPTYSTNLVEYNSLDERISYGISRLEDVADTVRMNKVVVASAFLVALCNFALLFAVVIKLI